MTGTASETSPLQGAQPLMYSDERDEDSGIRQCLTEQQQSKGSKKGQLGRSKFCSPPWRKFFLWHLGGDWIILIMLGVIPAIFSWAMDYGIDFGLDSTRWLYEKAHSNVMLQYLAWISIPILLISFAALFTYFVGPQAAGSGIPEIKTIVKGVNIKDHLSLNTLLAKLVGLTCALGSGMPLGKESPFVHIGGMCANQLHRFACFIGKTKKLDSVNIELVISGSAVGLAACFGSPVGGLLYGIEVASSFFMVRNYWKGLFAATVSAFMFRLLPMCAGRFETITPLYKTWYRQDHPYEPVEILSFCVLGILSGLAGAFFVFMNGVMVRFIRSSRPISKFLVKTRVLYPIIVTFVIATLTFPPGFGQFMAGELTQREFLEALFDNHTWSSHLQEEHFDHSDHSVAWKHPQVNVFGILAITFIMKFFMSAVAISMPVPCGAFVPAFVIGAALGRLVGEVAALVLPPGIHNNGTLYTPVPGSYAVAGAAAVSGAATHTISTAMIVYELTGQINFIYPILFAVIVANVVAQCLQPSLYDSLIRIRKLPYPTETTWDHKEGPSAQVEDIMVKDVKYISLNCTYKDLHSVLNREQYTMFPLVKSAESMILLGSIERVQLQALLSQHLGRARRLKYLQGCPQSEDKDTEISKDFSTTHSFSKPLQRPAEGGFQDSDITLRNLLCSHAIVEGLDDDTDVEDTMNKREILEWEEQQLEEKVDLNSCMVDPVSIQLVERTSLQKVQSIFSMLGLEMAYVTKAGQLVGLVSRRELQKGFEDSMKVQASKPHPPMETFLESRTRHRATNTPDASELQKLLGSQSSLYQSQEPEEK